MVFRSLGVLPALVAAALVAPVSVRADCVKIAPRMQLESRSSELIFSGKVIEITQAGEAGYRATFDVDRVWKGTVEKRFELYVWYLNPDLPRFEKGRSYVAVARSMTNPRERKDVGVGETGALVFAPVACTDGYTLSEFIRDLGPGKTPQHGR
jgi:hypothetical protein